MSASDKKKLRKEQYEQKLTERQKKAKAEAKQLQVSTVAFVVAMIAIVCLFVGIGSYKFWTQNGISEKLTTTTVITGPTGNTYKLNTVDLSYYYQDIINETVGSMYGQSYADFYFEYIQLDLDQSLTTQINPENNKTWSDTFLDYAYDAIQSDYAMYDLALRDGFTLSAEDQATLDAEITTIEASGDANAYLSSYYGAGANVKNYRQYRERQMIAEAYYTAHSDSLTFTDETLRAYEMDKKDNYNSYTYAYSYMSYKDFLEGGVEDEDGNKTYTEAENDAARKKAKEAADKLAKGTSVDEMKEIIKDIKVNESSQLAVNQEKNQSHSTASSPNNNLAKWLADDARTKGEVGIVSVTAEVEDTETEGAKKTVTNGYYVVYFQEKNDNTAPMDNVRHILISPEGGTIDDTTGETVYSEEELAAARDEAQALLDSWKNGAATEESFIALVKENTDDTGSAETGGLYANIHHSSEYVENFRAWAIDPSRKAGDTGLVSSDYGWHIMYYVGESDTSYRDQMITEELRADELNNWYQTNYALTKIERKNLKKLEREFLALAFSA